MLGDGDVRLNAASLSTQVFCLRHGGGIRMALLLPTWMLGRVMTTQKRPGFRRKPGRWTEAAWTRAQALGSCDYEGRQQRVPGSMMS